MILSRRRIWFLSLVSSLLVAASISVGPALADKRVALIIGNSVYSHVPRLPNPANDAEAMSILLKGAGFEVLETRRDLGINDMRRAVRDFSEKAQDADMALVFYAGHGIEVDGTNYLVPVDAKLERDIDVEDETVSLDRVLKVLEPAKRLRLVILDACRENPFAKTMKRTIASRAIGRGLASVEPATSDTLVAFAAKGGSTAADGAGIHSPFTAALLKHIATPGLDVRIAFGRVRDEVLKNTGKKQEPFVYGSLGGSTITLVSLTTGPRTDREPSLLDDKINAQAARDYELAAQVGTRQAWDSFLSRYPAGFYADLARAQRNKLSPNTSTAALPGASRPDTRVLPNSKNDKKQKGALQGGLLQQCLADYVRRKGAFRSEGQSDKVYKSRSDMTAMCQFAIAQRNYYWRYTAR